MVYIDAHHAMPKLPGTEETSLGRTSPVQEVLTRGKGATARNWQTQRRGGWETQRITLVVIGHKDDLS